MHEYHLFSIRICPYHLGVGGIWPPYPPPSPFVRIWLKRIMHRLKQGNIFEGMAFYYQNRVMTDKAVSSCGFNSMYDSNSTGIIHISLQVTLLFLMKRMDNK